MSQKNAPITRLWTIWVIKISCLGDRIQGLWIFGIGNRLLARTSGVSRRPAPPANSTSDDVSPRSFAPFNFHSASLSAVHKLQSAGARLQRAARMPANLSARLFFDDHTVNSPVLTEFGRENSWLEWNVSAVLYRKEIKTIKGSQKIS